MGTRANYSEAVATHPMERTSIGSDLLLVISISKEGKGPKSPLLIGAVPTFFEPPSITQLSTDERSWRIISTEAKVWCCKLTRAFDAKAGEKRCVQVVG